MRRIDAIPSKPETRVCEKHGEYEFRYMPFQDRFIVSEHCAKCAEEETLAREKREQEEKDKEEARFQRNKRINAGISKRNLYKTFDDYICQNEGQTKAKTECQKFVENFPSEKSLIMVGGVGTGKTLLASAMIESLIDNYRCEIVKLIDIIREIKDTWRKDSESTERNILKWYIGLDLLIIDEVGSQFGSDAEKLFIFDIIDGRYQEMKQTILISNLDNKGVKAVIGERCIDRLRDGGGSMIAFNWSSSRA